jgi:hypothetical protein
MCCAIPCVWDVLRYSLCQMCCTIPCVCDVLHYSLCVRCVALFSVCEMCCTIPCVRDVLHYLGEPLSPGDLIRKLGSDCRQTFARSLSCWSIGHVSDILQLAVGIWKCQKRLELMSVSLTILYYKYFDISLVLEFFCGILFLYGHSFSTLMNIRTVRMSNSNWQSLTRQCADANFHSLPLATTLYAVGVDSCHLECDATVR